MGKEKEMQKFLNYAKILKSISMYTGELHVICRAWWDFGKKMARIYFKVS